MPGELARANSPIKGHTNGDTCAEQSGITAKALNLKDVYLSVWLLACGVKSWHCIAEQKVPEGFPTRHRNSTMLLSLALVERSLNTERIATFGPGQWAVDFGNYPHANPFEVELAIEWIINLHNSLLKDLGLECYRGATMRLITEAEGIDEDYIGTPAPVGWLPSRSWQPIVRRETADALESALKRLSRAMVMFHPEFPDVMASGETMPHCLLLGGSKQTGEVGARESKPDGPYAGCSVWYRGQRVPVTGRSYKVIDCMWNRDHASFDALKAAVNDEVEDKTVHTWVNRANNALGPLKLPWELTADGTNRIVRKRPR